MQVYHIFRYPVSSLPVPIWHKTVLKFRQSLPPAPVLILLNYVTSQDCLPTQLPLPFWRFHYSFYQYKFTPYKLVIIFWFVLKTVALYKPYLICTAMINKHLIILFQWKTNINFHIAVFSYKPVDIKNRSVIQLIACSWKPSAKDLLIHHIK